MENMENDITPTEFLLMSIVGCTAMKILWSFFENDLIKSYEYTRYCRPEFAQCCGADETHEIHTD